MDSGEIQELIVPVVLAGGSGERLWPVSRSSHPKQFCSLTTQQAMLSDTIERITAPGFAKPVVVCNAKHADRVAGALRSSGAVAQLIVLEPVGRNTAAAAAVAALLVAEIDPQALVLMLPSDHVVIDTAGFRDLVVRGTLAARQDAIVTFGMTPDRPATGFGYIRLGERLPQDTDGYRVSIFVEKPDLETAQRYVADPAYLWNSGIFLFKPSVLLGELERLRPGMVAWCREAIEHGHTASRVLTLSAKAFANIGGISIDHAVMEHTEKAVVLPANIGWSDVGSWAAIWQLAERDAHGNVMTGDVLVLDGHNNLVRGDSRLIAAIGVTDLVIVDQRDALLIMPRARSEDVKKVVEVLRSRGRPEVDLRATVARHWDTYDSTESGARHQIETITVAPGSRLPQQRHQHSAGHLIVVAGTALVTRDCDTFLLEEGRSTYIPRGTTHRVENPGNVPLVLVEVQIGCYLDHDDNVRPQDDHYLDDRRTPPDPFALPASAA
jgi:mannose-1-phosphate guanylyltransferase/mannose-1-phosphate guanylyltransferase/mannose-6-phosphate isomerase